MNANQAMNLLAENEIGSRNLFKGLHTQKPLQRYLHEFDKNAKYPVTEKLYERGFYLPSAISLTHKDVSRIVSVLKQLK